MRSRAADINTDRLAFDEAAETINSLDPTLAKSTKYVKPLRQMMKEVRAQNKATWSNFCSACEDAQTVLR